MKPSVYIETTIPSYLVARPSRDVVLAGHQEATRDFWVQRRQEFDLFISSYVIEESRGGEAEMAAKRLESLKGIPMLADTPESDALALRLIARLGLPQKAESDAYHIAIAAVHSMDFLLTWNCTHINNLHMLRRIEETCREAGFVPPVIGTPDELI
ncbi:MAG: type II toxin-antitoxin system VapC family toxin [Prosthecobacter sp.]|uniref:type II toxin-antitoxin system VapC family toxin n=1 Tax=Prosthecobacter sp. TaxID=1965333 RepID=UPI0038FF3E33